MNIDNEINFLFKQATYANSNHKPFFYKNALSKFCLFLFIFLAGFVISFIVIPSQSKSEYTISESSEEYISPVEKAAYKQIVKQISIKENRHPNSIHAELRKRFNYRSYLYLTKKQYDKIYKYLQARL
ncbi:MAG: hypothetical protein J6V53_07300 [Alphaproteobacteria bacterium]|nr:hypothetical protein [Alphaproteobacteria bacterium]